MNEKNSKTSFDSLKTSKSGLNEGPMHQRDQLLLELK